MTETRPQLRSTPSRRSTRSASSIVVSVSFFDLRVPVDRGWAYERDAPVEIELLDEVLLAEMEVDGALVHGRVRPLALGEPEE